MVLISSSLTFAQNGNKGSKGSWTMQFNHDISAGGTFQTGVETDGNFYYVTQESSTDILKYDMNGNYVSSFSITGVFNLQDLAYDGTYFYGGRAGPWIWKLDFDNQTMVKQIMTGTQQVRSIAFDPANYAFWVSDWTTNDFVLIDTNGTVLNTIPAATHGLTGIFGTAYDDISPGGPYLWAITGQTGTTPFIYQIDINSGLQTGILHDLTKDNLNGLGGGLFIHPDIVSGTNTLGGVIKGKNLFGYDLSSTEPVALDAELQTLDVDAMVKYNAPLTFTGMIKNTGYTTIDTLDLSYSIDGGPAFTYTMTNLNLAPFTDYNYTHPDIWTPTTIGTYTITIWVSNPNGSPDMNTANDTLIINVVSVEFLQRKLLHEVFTSSTCGPCYNGNQTLSTVFNANPDKWTCVKYQMSWPLPGDPYYTAEGGVRKEYYGVSAVPNMWLDGGWNDDPRDYTQAIFDQYYDMPAFIGIDAYHQIINDSVYADVYLEPVADLNSTHLKLFVVVVEKRTEGNVGNNGEVEFHYVMMKMVPDAYGTAIAPLTNGITANYKTSANLLGTNIEDMNDLSVVVFLQDSVTKEVFQSCWSVEGIVGINEQDNNDEGILSLYPNPATEHAVIEFVLNQNSEVNIELYNLIGEKVYSEKKGLINSGVHNHRIDAHGLPSGIYFVRMQIGGKVFTKKLSVK